MKMASTIRPFSMAVRNELVHECFPNHTLAHWNSKNEFSSNFIGTGLPVLKYFYGFAPNTKGALVVALSEKSKLLLSLLLLKKVGNARLGVINTLSFQRPQPYNTNPLNERRERENRSRQKGSEQLGQ